MHFDTLAVDGVQHILNLAELSGRTPSVSAASATVDFQ